MRKALIGVTLVGATLALAAGCGAADDRLLEKDPERVVATSSALTHYRPDCNSHQYSTTYIVAQNLADPGQPVTYTKPISALDTELGAMCPPGKGAACAEQLAYTKSVYYGVYGAAGYYYKVAVMDMNLPNHDWKVWIAIPIVDQTTTSPGFYSTPPNPSVVHTPYYAPPVFWGSSPTTASGFSLRQTDHDNVWALNDDRSKNTTNVDGRIMDPCVAIVDPFGNFLDYSAELEIHDPNGCSSCSHF